MLNSKFMVSESDGNLYDTTKTDWSNNPLRVNYSKHHKNIEIVADLKATLRAGEYTFPGMYQLAFITSDGAILSFDAVKDEFYQCVYSIRNDINDGWKVTHCEIVYDDDDTPLYCEHTGKQLNNFD